MRPRRRDERGRHLHTLHGTADPRSSRRTKGGHSPRCCPKYSFLASRGTRPPDRRAAETSHPHQPTTRANIRRAVATAPDRHPHGTAASAAVESPGEKTEKKGGGPTLAHTPFSAPKVLLPRAAGRIHVRLQAGIACPPFRQTLMEDPKSTVSYSDMKVSSWCRCDTCPLRLPTTWSLTLALTFPSPSYHFRCRYYCH